MPPGLISSAAPGKKATAPKAAPRRRAAAAVPTGPPPSAAVVSDATTSVAPPTPEPTQTQSQTTVVEGAVQQEAEVRPRESDVEVAEHATPAPEIVAKVVPAPTIVEAAESETVIRDRESGGNEIVVPPTPEATEAENAQRSELAEREEEGRRREELNRQEATRRQEESSRQEEMKRLQEAGRHAEELARQEGPREENRQERAREAARREELALQVRQAAEQEEETHQNAVNAASNAAPISSEAANTTSTSGLTSTYVPPSASSATPATVDPTTLPPPSRPATAPKTSEKRARADKPSTAPARPAKKAKTSSTRSNAKVQAIANGGEEDEGVESGVVSTTETDATQTTPKPKAKRKPGPKKGAVRKKRTLSVATIQNSDDEYEGQDGEEDQDQEDGDAAAPAKKKPRKPRAKKATKRKPAQATAGTADGETAAEGGAEPGEENQNAAEDDDASDPELHEIDPNTLSMWELSRDEVHGKKSERGKKMEEIDWEKVAQDRRDAANALVASLRTEVQPQEYPSEDVVASVEDPTGTAEPEGPQNRRSQSRSATAAAAEPTPAPAPAPANDDLGLGFVLDADGNIVADENTLTFTRDAAAQAAANSDAPVEEFTDLTQTINRFTNLNANRRDPADRLPVWKLKSDPWSEDETDKFYDALRMFGTDFFIISKMFAPKTRRMIKNKFNREEKLDPKRINRALTGIVETPMSLEHYSRETGFAMEKFTKYDGIQHAQSVIDSENVGKEVVDEKEAKRRERELAKEERDQQREKEKEERKAKRKARTKKGIAAAGGAGFGGGGPVESVVGEAE